VNASESLRGIATLTQVSRGSAPTRLRKAMGRFATGVTVVTTAQGEQVHGMTANGVMSVSLDPPLVVVSLGDCKMDLLLPRTRRYGISVLGVEQEDLARHFAGRPVESVAPRFTWWRELPFVDGALAHVGCHVEEIHEAGDHRLWVGRVEYMEYRDGEPLLFYAGAFDKLAPRG
jgi:flavin reductase (DIM6/NTAB) family NADH-FMN oxidoreductase RutF